MDFNHMYILKLFCCSSHTNHFAGKLIRNFFFQIFRVCYINRVFTIAAECDEFDFVQIFFFFFKDFPCWYINIMIYSVSFWCNDKPYKRSRGNKVFFFLFEKHVSTYTFHVNKFTWKYFILLCLQLYLHVVWKNRNISCYCYGVFIFFLFLLLFCCCFSYCCVAMTRF